MEIRYVGGEADDGLVDLSGGAESLAGLGRVANLVAHYVATGEVRFRGPYSNKVRFYIDETEDGSLKVLTKEIARLSSAAANAAATQNAKKLLKHVVARALGQVEEGQLELDGLDVPAGTVDVLAEAATPGLERSHKWIDTSAKRIVINDNAIREVQLDERTKEYLKSEDIDERSRTQDVSVGALNVNSRNGRVYFHDLGRTVPFFVPRDAEERTIPTLSRYLTQYAEKTGATVNIQFRRIRYPDGRLKKIIIYDCYALGEAA
ncbi:hypothetical protein [Qipengyuania aquimaris]|uniref:DUF7946 domain-containing protein n=1 Tax=Qipengyuania aquimaris TaxID=255984 RepID=UPI001CD40732|nr:hypothetical protein [Qipengyuania aquimaris]MCA0903247.1 hypothetical protein [Qipengyuania aquimaris]